MHGTRTTTCCSRVSSVWRLAVAIVLLVTATGAAAFAPLRARAQDAGTVTFAFWGDPAEEAAYERVVSEFEAANPGIDVQTVYTPGQGDYQTKVATDFAGGDPPDVFLINYRNYGQYAARDALEPLGPRLAQSTTVSEADFYDIPLDAFRYRGGELTCIPQNVSSLVVYYNRNLFEANGVPLPTNEWTWDQFLDAAKKLTKDTDGDGLTDTFGLAVDPSMIRYVSFIWGAGGEVVDDLDNPTTLTLDTPEALAGINWFIELGATGHAVAPNEAQVAAEDDESRFMRGGAAMLMQSRRVVPTLREIEDFVWDVAPVPIGPAGPATVLHSDAFCMAADSQDKDAAWKFIEYAAGPAGQTALAETGRTVPSLKAIAESDLFLKGNQVGAVTGVSLAPANSQVFLDALAYMRRVPSTSTWPEIEDAFDVPFKRAFYVEIDVPGAIEVATFRSRDAFARALQEEQQRTTP